MNYGEAFRKIVQYASKQTYYEIKFNGGYYNTFIGDDPDDDLLLMSSVPSLTALYGYFVPVTQEEQPKYRRTFYGMTK